MDRTEFIKTIMDLYPRVFDINRPKQFQGWIDRYKNAIPENWDFKRLMWYFETKWTSVIEPPPPSFFYKFKEDVKPETKREEIKMTKEEIEESLKSFQLFKENLKHLATSKDINSISAE